MHYLALLLLTALSAHAQTAAPFPELVTVYTGGAPDSLVAQINSLGAAAKSIEGNVQPDTATATVPGFTTDPAQTPLEALPVSNTLPYTSATNPAYVASSDVRPAFTESGSLSFNVTYPTTASRPPTSSAIALQSNAFIALGASFVIMASSWALVL